MCRIFMVEPLLNESLNCRTVTEFPVPSHLKVFNYRKHPLQNFGSTKTTESFRKTQQLEAQFLFS
jgi:hypothetical protein